MKHSVTPLRVAIRSTLQRLIMFCFCSRLAQQVESERAAKPDGLELSQPGRIFLSVQRKAPAVARREEIAPNRDKHYIRCDDQGRIKSLVEDGRSRSDDAPQRAKNDTRPGQGDHRAKWRHDDGVR